MPTQPLIASSPFAARPGRGLFRRGGPALPLCLVFVLAAGILAASAVGAQSRSTEPSDPSDRSFVDLRGTVRLVEDGDDETDREFRSALAWFEPTDGAPPEVPDEPFEMVTVRKDFLPRVLAVPVGATVRFPNQDPILHNVFSRSAGNRFDLGLYRGGEAESATFHAPGIVRVFCNVHHSMVAYVAVLETSHYGRLQRDGTFLLEDVPAGPGRLTVWHERAEPRSVDLVLPLDGPLEIDVRITKPKVPRHRNKFGQPYSRKRRGRAY